VPASSHLTILLAGGEPAPKQGACRCLCAARKTEGQHSAIRELVETNKRSQNQVDNEQGAVAGERFSPYRGFVRALCHRHDRLFGCVGSWQPAQAILSCSSPKSAMSLRVPPRAVM